MALLVLTKGQSAIVDDNDFEWLSQWKWLLLGEYAARFVTINGKRKAITLSRVIMNAPDHLEVDHIDGNKMNNQRSNLRLATHAENMRNKAKQSGRSSQFKGVSFYKPDQCWCAYIRINGKHTHIGRFPTEIAAAKAYDVAAQLHYGEFARPNFSE